MFLTPGCGEVSFHTRQLCTCKFFASRPPPSLAPQVRKRPHSSSSMRLQRQRKDRASDAKPPPDGAAKSSEFSFVS